MTRDTQEIRNSSIDKGKITRRVLSGAGIGEKRGSLTVEDIDDAARSAGIPEEEIQGLPGENTARTPGELLLLYHQHLVERDFYDLLVHL